MPSFFIGGWLKRKKQISPWNMMHLMKEMSGDGNQHIQKDKQVLQSMNVERQYTRLPPLALLHWI